MQDLRKNLSLFFSAGCLGGLLNSLAVWMFGVLGITTGFGVKIAPHLSFPWLYPRIVWGGIWGLLFFIPLLNTRLFTKGILLSLGPSLVQLFIVFPLKAKKGMMGLELGTLTPAFVLFFNVVWGVAVAGWLRLCSKPVSRIEDA